MTLEVKSYKSHDQKAIQTQMLAMNRIAILFVLHTVFLAERQLVHKTNKSLSSSIN